MHRNEPQKFPGSQDLNGIARRWAWQQVHSTGSRGHDLRDSKCAYLIKPSSLQASSPYNVLKPPRSHQGSESHFCAHAKPTLRPPAAAHRRLLSRCLLRVPHEMYASKYGQRGGIGTGRTNREDITTHQSSSVLDTIEAGNQWPVHIAVVVPLVVEDSRGERSGPRDRDGNACAGGELGYMWS
ncbi:hypothetical protein K438DRAFT_1787851 [Mycena galopus ATCC 62051]|nr:hypothetical protein K438DRAFT_1787851 [Mycena galopus ATCC 62051]